MISRLLLIFLSLPFQTLCAPQKDPNGKDIIDDSADFGTPEHDNTVHHELSSNRTNAEISHIMAADYFTDVPLPCDNNTAPGGWMIYCSGRLLQAVMSVQLYHDSKTFVDKPMKKNMTGEIIMAEFDKRFPGSIEDITKEEVRKFVDEFFDKEGNELDVCELPDWVPNPLKIAQIKDETYQAFAQKLHFIWIQLCRQMKEEVKEEPERFSVLYVPHSFILPGGRFREFYYWDAYWIIKGLLASQLYSTARNMILNLSHIINEYGFIPNGGRVYYLSRSQPPFFAPMVYEYYQATQDLQFVSDMVPMIEKEFEFWTNNRRVNLTMGDENDETITMFQYRTEAETPRPESFREDVISARHIDSALKKRQFFKDLGSAAESGYDFSSRWFKDGFNITTIETTNVVPVDLNAFICYNMNILSFFYEQLGNPLKHSEWSGKYRQFRDKFTRVFYVASRKGWYDYNIRSNLHNTDFYPSIAAPLFTQCYDPLNFRLAVDIYNQIDSIGALKYDGGVPTSLRETRQQWDFPNGWSPLNHMVIEGLRKSLSPLLQQKAYILAEKWLRTNLLTFNASDAMWEKYDVNEPKAKLATGGEYEVQAGFGWTNGAALDLIMTYSDRLKYSGNRLESLLGTLPTVATSTSTKLPVVSSTTFETSTSVVKSSNINYNFTWMYISMVISILYIF